MLLNNHTLLAAPYTYQYTLPDSSIKTLLLLNFKYS